MTVEDTNKNHTVEQWGRQLPNGTVEWQTADDWHPPFADAGGRELERRTYAEQLAALGIEQTDALSIKFFKRTKSVMYSTAEEVVDPPWVDPVEPPASDDTVG